MSAFQIFTQPSQQALDTAANVLSGATLTFSLTGTSTPTNAYADKTLTTPLANPLSADSAGVFAPIFLDPTIVYRVILKTVAGATLQTWDPANEDVIAAIDSDYIGQTLDSLKRTDAEVSAELTPVNYAYPPGHAYRYGTNTTPGTTDMTTALEATLLQAYEDGGASPYWPGDTLLVDNITISDSVHIRTEGYATTLKQIAGFTELAILYMAGVSDVEIEPISVIGNMSDSGEWNHAVSLGSTCSHIRIGGIRGTNIRGDVLNIAGTAGAGSVFDVQVGQVVGTNVYREVVSITGGEGIEIDAVIGTQVGYRVLDVEPNEESQSPTGVHIKYVRGSNIQVAGANLADTTGVGSVVIDHLDLDNSLHADSTPGYPTHPSADGNIAFILGDCQSVRIGTFKARGYGERVISDTESTVQCHLVIDYFDCDTSNDTETTFKCLIAGDTLARLDINGGVIVLQDSDRYICKDVQCALKNLRVYNGCIAASADNCEFENISYDGTDVSDAIFNDIDSSVIKNFVAANASGATLMSACQDNILMGCSGTFSAVNSGGGVNLYMKSTLNSTTYELRSDLQGSKTYDPGSLSAGASESVNVTVAGAAIGDFAQASFSLDLQGVTLAAQVNATDTVTVSLSNHTSGTLDIGSGTLRARVWKA